MKKNIGLIFCALALVLSLVAVSAVVTKDVDLTFIPPKICTTPGEEICVGIGTSNVYINKCTASGQWAFKESCERGCIQYDIDGERGTTCENFYTDKYDELQGQNSFLMFLILLLSIFAIYSIIKQRRK